MATLDWLIILAYFASLAGLTWWVLHNNKDTAEDYFLAGRGLGWFVVGASIFASNIGSEHLVGLAGSGATSGVALAHYELHAWCLLVLGWVLVPFYLRSRVFTTPEFLELRFSPTARWLLTAISLVAYVLTKIAVGIFAGGVVFGTLMPEMSLQLGRLHLQQLLDRVGRRRGPHRPLHGRRRHEGGGLHRGAADVHPGRRVAAAHRLRPERAGRMGRAADDARPGDVQPVEAADSGTAWKARGRRCWNRRRMAWYFNDNYPWVGMLFCAPIIGLWYWCTDQYIVQRTLIAPNETEARRGTIFAALPEAAAGLHLHHPRHDRGGARQERQDPGPGDAGRRQRPYGQRGGTGGVSAAWCSTCCRSACAAWWWPGCWRR